MENHDPIENHQPAESHDPIRSPAWVHHAEVRTDADLLAVWRALLEPLGFERRTLWVIFLDPRGRPAPAIIPIDDVPRWPDDDFLSGLASVAGHVCSDLGEGSRAAFLLSRPGRSLGDPSDLAWAVQLGRSVPGCHVVHLANDVTLRQVTPDELVAAG